MLNERRSGVLLHPTSLPGPHGIGDLGPGAYHFVDWLASAGQTLWQVLPLTPIGPGNSPYSSVSAFAGSPLLVALEPLVDAGWLLRIDAAETERFDPHRVDFGAVVPWRVAKLRLAEQGFNARASAAERADLDAYCARESVWLDDYALFMALDAHFSAADAACIWPQWDAPLARRDPSALAVVREHYSAEIRFWKFVQWCFGAQWARLRAYAASKHVRVVGDLPIFIAHHSADCWARPDLYRLDAGFMPTVVAGVPPDFFSATGQRWGNPLYRWDAFEREGYGWWIARMRRQFDLADIVRIDHFRGFAGNWEIPATCPTAVEGRWAQGPGARLFSAIESVLGRLPIIAEDLGLITPDVVELRDRFGYPGMRIVQFGFGADAQHAFLPHNYCRNTVTYTGTHDNDTVRGWWSTCTDRERDFARIYLSTRGDDVHWAMIRAASASTANTAIFPLQDILWLDGYHRFNTPGVTGCWTWRFTWDWVGSETAGQLAALSAAYGRAPIEWLKLSAWPDARPKP